MNVRSIQLTVCAGLAVSVLAVGCGGGGDSDATGASSSGSAEAGSLSKAEFVKRANTACAKAWEEALGNATAYVDKHSARGVPEEVLNRRGIKVAMVDAIQGEVDALRALDAPEGDQRKIETILTSLEASYKEAAAQPATLSAAQLESHLEAAKPLRDYGLSRCRQ